MKKLVFMAAVLAIAVAGFAGRAGAHSISIGTYNAGSPGSVTLAMGSYHYSGPAEGTMTLTAGPAIPATATYDFALTTSVKPTGLIDGDTNFYIEPVGDITGDFSSATNTTGNPQVNTWQLMTFSGLVAGTYSYQLTGMVSAVWMEWNNSVNNWSGTFTITGEVADINPVPEPTTVALLGIGLVGLIGGAARKKLKKKAIAKT